MIILTSKTRKQLSEISLLQNDIFSKNLIFYRINGESFIQKIPYFELFPYKINFKGNFTLNKKYLMNLAAY